MLFEAWVREAAGLLRSTAIGVGRLLGDSYTELGVASAQEMFRASLEEQVLYVARFLAFKKDVVARSEPSADDFRAVARFYVGPGYEARNYHEGLERWYREFHYATTASPVQGKTPRITPARRMPPRGG